MGYEFTGNGDVCYSVSSCGTVSCSAGYHFEVPSYQTGREAHALQLDRSYSAPTCYCDVDGGKFLCLGCFENQCVPPTNEILGYQLGGDRATCTKVSTCRIQGCRTGYLLNGAVTLRCDTHGSRFVATGCDEVLCPAGAQTTAEEVCACKPGYAYVRVDGVKAPLWTGTEWLHGCSRVNCPADTLGDEACTCRLGYLGTPTWDRFNEVWTHICTPAPCPTNARRTCDANTGVCGCQCNLGFESTLTAGATQWDYNTQSWLFTCTPFCSQGYRYDPNTARWDGTRWIYTCVEAPCPANMVRRSLGNGQLVCECAPPLEGEPLWNSVLQRWDHICGPPRTSVPCPMGSSPLGICNCDQGYRYRDTNGPVWNGTGWTHQCLQANCPANAAWGLVQNSQYYACVCLPGYTGTPLWSVTREVWLHTCTPVVGLNTGVVTLPTVTASVPSTRVIDNFVTGISSATTLLPPQCSNTNPDLFTTNGQPTLNLSPAQTSASLSFTTQRTGTATVTCMVTDTRVPAQTTQFQTFTIVTGGTAPPVITGAVCTNGLCGVARTPVTLLPGRTNTYANFANVIPAAGRTTTCVSGDPALNPVQIDANNNLIATVAAGARVSTTVTCTVRDNGVQRDSFSFVAQTQTSGVGGILGFVQRVRIRLSRLFSRSLFAAAIRQSSSVALSQVNTWWICPASSCPNGDCPTTSQARAALGCRAADQIGAERFARALQDAGEDVYVEFTVVPTANTDPDAAQQQGAQDLQATINTCNAGGVCPLDQVGSQWSEVSVEPATAQPVRTTPYYPVDDGGDSSLSTGAIIGIVCGIVVFLLLLALLIWCCCRGKGCCGDKDKDRETENVHHHHYNRAIKGGEGDFSGDSNQFPDVNKSGDRELSGIEERVDPSYDPYGPQNPYNQGAPAEYDQGVADYDQGQEGKYGERGFGESETGYTQDDGEYQTDQPVKAMYEGEMHDGTIWTRDDAGTYTVQWWDGTHTTGIPAEQIEPRQ